MPAKSPSRHRKTILVVSKEPDLVDIRAHVLEDAGYQVVSATDLLAVRSAYKQFPEIALMIIGYSLSPDEKRRVWTEAKDFCETPILELYEDGHHELVASSRLFTFESHTPTDFLSAVNSILRGTAKNKAAG